jgi:hypothetical protein
MCRCQDIEKTAAGIRPKKDVVANQLPPRDSLPRKEENPQDWGNHPPAPEICIIIRKNTLS